MSSSRRSEKVKKRKARKHKKQNKYSFIEPCKQVSEVPNHFYYNSFDLLSYFAALQLMPANATRLISLEAYIHNIVSLGPQAEAPYITYNELKNIAKEDKIGKIYGHLEDPIEGMFTETITFIGGGYTVFPGISADSVYIVKNICKALFLTKLDISYIEIINPIKEIIINTLKLSNIIAKKAGLSRNLEPGDRKNKIVIPEHSLIDYLKNVVVFDNNTWQSLFSNSLDCYIFDLSTEYKQVTDYPYGDLLNRPIIKYCDKYCVSNANVLLLALIRQISQIVIKNNYQKEFCDLFSIAIWECIKSGFERLDHNYQDILLPNLGIPHSQQGLFSFDHDKMAYIISTVDDLSDYNIKNPDELPKDISKYCTGSA